MKNKHRIILQSVIFICTIIVGIRFHFFLENIYTGNNDAVKPYAVEGFLPIGALAALKQFIVTGIYDKIHPAALTIFLFAIIISIIFKRSFCGYICPVGFVSEIVSRFSRNIKINKYIEILLSSIKYIILFFFLYAILYRMDILSIRYFLNSSYYIASDAKMYYLFAYPSLTTIITLLVLIIITFFIKNFWCRFLCPYGALLGLVSLLSPFKIKRNDAACTKCKKCTEVCPQSIDIHLQKKIITPECIGCMKCIDYKSKKDCLKITHTSFTPAVITFIIGAAFILMIISANIFGIWKSEITTEEYRAHLFHIQGYK